jgi:heme A synthase
LLATLSSIHRFGATVLLIYAVLLGLWGTYHYFRNQPVSGGFRSSYLIMAALIPLQGLLGVAALFFSGHPREGILHMVYGVFAVIFIPGAYLYSRGGSVRRETLILAAAAWIVAIAFFRGIATG